VGNSKSVLIIGGSGYVGTHLALHLRKGYKVFSTFNQKMSKIPGVTHLPYSVDNRNWVKRIVLTTQPDVIIYAAGNNSLDRAEAQPRHAENLHSSGPAILANCIEITQPRVIYLSNPYVFDGTRGNYHETDIVLPWSALGRAKLGGENVIKSKCLNYVILRSSPVFGRSNGMNLSMLDYLRMSLDRGKRVELSPKELYSFAAVDGLSETVVRLIESGIRNRILHYGGLTKISMFEFAKLFSKKFGYDSNLIAPKANLHRKSGMNEEFIFDFSLNSTQVAETLKIKPLLLEESFDLIEKQLVTHL
jgi:dTDP-4-dehydrorhamnose reductase